MSVYQPRATRKTGTSTEAWRQALSEVLTVFGRLVYISSLRDQNSGRYKNYRLAEAFGEEETDRVLRGSHVESFSEWLCFSLEQQKADLDLYLSGLEVDKRTALETWEKLAPFRNLVPADTMEVERQLFLADLDALLELLNAQFGIGRPPGPVRG